MFSAKDTRMTTDRATVQHATDGATPCRAIILLVEDDSSVRSLAARLLAVASSRRDLYESVDNPLRPGEPLYLGLLSALFESGVGHAPTAEFMRTLLLDPKFSTKAFSYLVNEDPASLYPHLKKVLTPQNEMWQFLLRMLVMGTSTDRFLDLAKQLRGLDPQIKKAVAMRTFISNYIQSEKARREENGEAGFSLIELIVVVVILGVLAAVAIPIFLNIQNEAKQNAARMHDQIGSDRQRNLVDLGFGEPIAGGIGREHAAVKHVEARAFCRARGNLCIGSGRDRDERGDAE